MSAKRRLFQVPPARDPQASWYSVPPRTLRKKKVHLSLLNWCQKAAFGMAVPIGMMVAFVMVVLVTKSPFATSGQTPRAATTIQQSKLHLFFPRKAS